jgi:AraC-like DNA-binding protein
MLLTMPPPAPLAPFVTSLYWYDEPLDAALELALPTGRQQLIVNLAEDEQRWYDGPGFARVHRLPAATVSGASAAPLCIDTAEQRQVVGACFRPGGGFPFFGTPDGTGDLPLDALWGRDGATLAERLRGLPNPRRRLVALAELLLARMRDRPAGPDPLVGAAAVALERGLPVATVADRLGRTDRGLARRFAAHTGFTPKLYARIRRFQRVAADSAAGTAGADRVDWAGLAAAHGYVDQSHLIHDFRSFASVTPTRYRPRAAGMPNHLPVRA